MAIVWAVSCLVLQETPKKHSKNIQRADLEGFHLHKSKHKERDGQDIEASTRQSLVLIFFLDGLFVL